MAADNPLLRGHGLQSFLTAQRSVMVPVAIALAALSSVHICLLWVGLFRRYKRRIFAMRQGIYFYDRRVFTEQGASSYIGYQCSFMLANSLIFMFVFMIVLFFAASLVMG
eukprot:516533-Prymnesium_polylepis.1